MAPKPCLARMAETAACERLDRRRSVPTRTASGARPAPTPGGAEAFGSRGQNGFGQGRAQGWARFGQGGIRRRRRRRRALPGATGAERVAAAGLCRPRPGPSAGGCRRPGGDRPGLRSRSGRAGGSDGGEPGDGPTSSRPSLGSIEVQYGGRDGTGRVQAHVVADQGGDLDLLRQRPPVRCPAPWGRWPGLQTDTGSLNFSLKGEDQQGGGGGAQAAAAPDRASTAPAKADTGPAADTKNWTVADGPADTPASDPPDPRRRPVPNGHRQRP